MDIMMFNNDIINMDKARISLKSPTARYGIAIFDATNIEYCSEKNEAIIFRIDEHINRFLYGCKTMGINIGFSKDEIKRMTLQYVEKCKIDGTTGLRWFAYYRDESSFMTNYSADLAIYILNISDMRKSNRNPKLMISDYHKSENGMLPVQVKSTAHYAYARIAVLKANQCGYDDVIFFNIYGNITECSRSNIFLIKKDCVYTPNLSSCVLNGIIRDTIIQICNLNNIRLVEKELTRYDLYSSDCVFTTGSSLGITPVAQVDNVLLNSKENEILKKIIQYYNLVIEGKMEKQWTTKISLV